MGRNEPNLAGISPQASDPLPLSVREGTYDDNYDIEAWLDGEYAGLAFRVKDKLNYSYVTQSFSVPGSYLVYVWEVRDGWISAVPAAAMVPIVDLWTQRHVHIKVSQDDIGLWLEDNNQWVPVIDPATDGANVLAWPDAGSVGLVAGWLGAADCYLVGVGDDLDNSHTLSLVNEAAVHDTFPASWVPAYDAAGNLVNDKLYKYSYDAWNRLVQVTRQWPATSPQVIAEYAYDGLGRRVRKAVSHSGDRNGVQWFYYNHRWQLLEVRSGADQPIQQFVWGPNYIDEAICMDVDTNTDDVILQGNVSFTAEYLRRACSTAAAAGAGVVLMHNHFTPGWQGVSRDDAAAERSRTAFVLTATGLPLVGMTIGTDESWSARFWQRTGPKQYKGWWCCTVRVVGKRLRTTYHPMLAPAAAPRDELIRTVSAWGEENQSLIARTHVGVVGVGSVGRLIVECLARMGVRRLTVIDFDHIERKNLDRQICAYPDDVLKRRRKIDMASEGFLEACTAADPDVDAVFAAVTEPEGYAAALNCDVIFCCVDRPWGRHILNHLAYAHLIPVVEGGIIIRTKDKRFRGAEWSTRTAGPGRCCLACAGAYNVGLVDDERRGLLDDPSYIEGLPPDVRAMASQNVMPFSMSLAGHQVLQFCGLVTGMLKMPDLGDQRFHYNLRQMRVTDRTCGDNCLCPSLVATGESIYSAAVLTAPHPAAEAIRRSPIAAAGVSAEDAA